MNKKEMKKLSRLELLEILLAQSREIDALKEELTECRKELDQKHLAMNQAGNIAEAALKLNGVFEAAQKAADQYLESIKYQANPSGYSSPAEELPDENQTNPTAD